jgi:hypothetical protein
MDYAMIGKIEKAKRYAEERDRIQFSNFEVTIRGENNTHTVKYDNNRWQCTCSFFHSHGVCSHTMAMERVLEKMIPSRSSSAAAGSED